MFVLPFTIWTLRGFVAGVPVELEEAAMVDGASRFTAFRKITFPLVAPGLVATGVFALIQAWNEFIFALVIMNRPEKQTLPVWLQAFNEGARGTDWGGVMAGSTIMAVPVILFFLVVQKQDHDGPHRRRGEGMTPPREDVTVGVDVGGTSTRIVVFSGAGEQIESSTVADPAGRTGAGRITSATGSPRRSPVSPDA